MGLDVDVKLRFVVKKAEGEIPLRSEYEAKKKAQQKICEESAGALPF